MKSEIDLDLKDKRQKDMEQKKIWLSLVVGC